MIAVINGKVITMAGPAEDLVTGGQAGTILMDKGKIVAFGQDIMIPHGAKIIDAEDYWIMPGLIDAHCHLGICEEIYEEGEDTNEDTDPVTAHLRAIDAINPLDIGFIDAQKGGVTTVAVAPGSANVIGGTVVTIKTNGHIVDKMLVKETTALKCALGENPKKVYGCEKKSPKTRMAVAGLIRQALVSAENHERDEDSKLDLGQEVLIKATKGSLPVHFHAHRADDIVTAIRIAEEFDLNIVIVHGTEGHLVGEYLAEKAVPVIAGPLLVNRAKVEMKEISWQGVAQMAEDGVRLALCTDHPVVPINYLLLCAGLAHKAGLDRTKAMAAVTIEAARILDIDDKVGSLEEGKDADLIFIKGDPLSLDSVVEKVFINGVQVV